MTRSEQEGHSRKPILGNPRGPTKFLSRFILKLYFFKTRAFCRVLVRGDYLMGVSPGGRCSQDLLTPPPENLD